MRPPSCWSGEAPTIREIGRSVGLSSPSSVAYRPEQMEQLGVIRRTARRGWGRGIALGWRRAPRGRSHLDSNV
ncbi:hypothetical protein [Streptomyces albiflavescens]|uniref:LexA family protein n=1 Tax=Streptomyces albiflavescens TaxID=1623582 RepID=UPI00166D4EB4|nr:hypothetical protein [Streptomyces albiflavescens]